MPRRNLAVAALAAAVAPSGAQSVVFGSGNACPTGHSKLTSNLTCRAALDLLSPNVDSHEYWDTETSATHPSGCYACPLTAPLDPDCNGVWFNLHPSGAAANRVQPICQRNFETIVKGNTLFVGDSDVDLWPNTRTLVPGSYNMGVGGYTCRRVEAEVADLLTAFAPTTVVLVCGENDLANAVPVHNAFARFRRIVDAYIAGGARVVMLGTKPEPVTTALHNKYAQYDEKVRCRALELAGQDTAASPPLVFIDVSPAFVALGNPASLYRSDGLHLTDATYAAHWSAWLRAALEESPQRCVVWRSGVCVQNLTMVTANHSCPVSAAARPAALAALASALVVLVW